MKVGKMGIKIIGLTALALFLLAGCGFKLRGATEFPFQTVKVSGHPFEAVVRELTHQLRGFSQLKLVDSLDQADIVVNILEVNRDEEILIIGRAGHVQEYEYFLTIRYQLCGKGAKVCQPEQHLKLRRQMSYDERQILAKQNEERFLRKNMEQEAVRLILLRMSGSKAAMTDQVSDAQDSQEATFSEEKKQ